MAYDCLAYIFNFKVYADPKLLDTKKTSLNPLALNPRYKKE